MAGTYDGSIRINTKIESAGAKAELASLSKSLKGFAAVVGVAFGVAAIVNFSKECINLASDLNEVQNVVDTTFGSSAGLIEQFADTAATSFGLSELAAKKYTSTMGAMLKSMGFTQAAAADMSIEMAGLAGDMASFYNLSSDEAFDKIRSGISGETEPLKQLGVNLSVANLEAYALAQGMTTAYDSLSEQNKALLRYNYLLDATSDAQGDFAKTSDSWANQVRVQQMQWDSMKATLGGAFKQILTPVLQTVNHLVGRLNALARAFAGTINLIYGNTDALDTGASTATESIDSLTDATEASAAAAKGLTGNLASFDELNVLASPTGGSTDMAATEGMTTASEDAAKAAKEANDALDIKLYYDFAKALSGLKDAFAGFGDSVSYLWNKTGLKQFVSLIAQAALIAGINLLTGAFDVLAGVIDVVSGVIVWFTGLFTGDFDKMYEGGKKVLEGLGKIIEGVFVALLGQEAVDAIKKFFSEWATRISSWWTDDVVPWFTSERWLGLFQNVKDAVADFLLSISTKWQEIGVVASEVWEGIKAAWSASGEWFNTNVVTPIANFFGNLWTGIKGGASTLASFISDKVITPIVSLFKGLYNSLVGIMEGVVNGFVKIINAFIVGINQAIKTINKIPGVSLPSIGTLKTVSIPRLAQGAVIPPNREFMAVLGDQKSGTNIEAPLDTIIEAVKAAFAEMGGAGGDTKVSIEFKGSLAQLGRVLEPVVTIEKQRKGASLVTG